MRRAIGGQILDPELAERLVDHLVALGGDGGPAQQPDLEVLRRHLDGEAHGLLHPAGGGDMEGDIGDGLGRQVDLLDLAARPEDDGLVVRGPGHGRIDPLDRPGLLHVAVQAVIDRDLLAGGDVHDEQGGFVPDPADEGQGLAVMAGGRADRAARAGDIGLDLTGLPVQAADQIDLAIGVLGVLEGSAGRGVVAEIEIAAVGGEGGFVGVLLVGALLGELQAVAAGPVIEPHLPGAQGAGVGEVLARDDVVAVRRPGRLVQQAEGLLGHRVGVGAVAVHDPDIVAAAPVGGVGDPAAVGGVTGLHVPGHAGGQGLGFAAGDGDRVDVAQQVEGDLLAVGADIEGQPGAGLDVDLRLMTRPGRGVDIPFGCLGLGHGGRIGGPGDGHGQESGRGGGDQAL